MTSSQTATARVRDFLASARDKAAQLRSEATEAERVEKVWSDFLRFLSDDWPMHLLSLREKEAQLLGNAFNQPTDHLEFEDLFRRAEAQTQDVILHYPKLIEDAFRKSNLPLDSDSRHPRYTMEQRFFLLEIDERQRTAKLSNHEGLLFADLPADIEAVVQFVIKEHQRIFGRAFDGSRFARQIRNQYLAIIQKENRKEGDALPIRHITRRMGKNVKGFRSDEFLIDLSRLLEEGPTELDGWKLDLQQTKDTNQGMLLHGPAGRGYIGFLLFKRI